MDVDGAENEYETGLGRICNDGSFPFALVKSRFGRLIDERVNCVFAKRKGDVWIKSKRDIKVNEELLVCYSADVNCWKSVFRSAVGVYQTGTQHLPDHTTRGQGSTTSTAFLNAECTCEV